MNYQNICLKFLKGLILFPKQRCQQPIEKKRTDNPSTCTLIRIDKRAKNK